MEAKKETSVINELVKQRLEELLAEKGMSSYRLRNESGMSPSTISNLRTRPNSSIQIDTLYRICQGLGITIQEFFTSPLFDVHENEDEDK